MLHKKATTYEQTEKPNKEKKVKQNAYEEIRKLVENSEVEEAVQEVKGKQKNHGKEKSCSFKLFD